jgi:uncharacterized protein
MIQVDRYVGEGVGEPTLRDIINELQKPGRDPRATFDPPRFRDDITTLAHLEVGMQLEGVVTNVTAFGAFVDLGVHQDGLVHISELSDRFVKNPHEVVHTGDRLKVRVLAIDLERKRIALSAKSPRENEARAGTHGRARGRDSNASTPRASQRDDGRGTTKSPRGGHKSERRQGQGQGEGGKQDQAFSHNPFAKLLKRT